MVDLPPLLRTVEDLLPGVVARGDAGRERLDELAGGQVLLAGVEDGAVEEVDLGARTSSTIAAVHACASG